MQFYILSLIDFIPATDHLWFQWEKFQFLNFFNFIGLFILAYLVSYIHSYHLIENYLHKMTTLPLQNPNKHS